MKRLISIALVVFALAAIPAAFADDTTPAQQPVPAAKAHQLGQLRQHLKVVAHRLRKQCSGTTPDQKCLDKAQKVADRLGKLIARLQALQAKVQAYLNGTTTDSSSVGDAADALGASG
jgi:hypothetical protein